MKKTKSIVIIIMLTMLFTFFSISQVNAVERITDLKAVVTKENVEISWSSVQGADGYEVYGKIGSSDYQYIGSTNTNRVYVVGFNNGEDYKLKVRPYEENNGQKNYADFSNEVNFKFGDSLSINANIGKVENVKISVNGIYGELEWNGVSGAIGYEIYASIDNGNYSNLGAINLNKVGIIGFEEGRTYNFKVRAYVEESGLRKYGEFSEVITIKYDKIDNEDNDSTETINVEKVTGLRVKMDGERGTFNWNKVTGADGYELEVDIPNYGKATYETINTNISLKGFEEHNKPYVARVRAYKNINGEKKYGEYSDSIEIEYKEEVDEKIDRVSEVNIEIDGTTGTFSWDKIDGAYGYEVQINIPGYGTETYETTKTNIKLKNFEESDDSYSVRVRAYKYVDGERMYGSYSSKKNFKIEKELEKVSGFDIEVDGSSVTFSWNRVSNIDGYDLIINKLGLGDVTYNVNGTSLYMDGFSDGEYTAKVRAYKYVDGKKVYGDYSKERDFTIEKELGKANGFDVDIDGDSATFNWNRVNNADGYELMITIPGVGDSTYNVIGTSLYMRGFTLEEYTAKVRAYKYVGGSKIYGEFSKTITFKGNNTIGKVENFRISDYKDQATFSWNRVEGASGYELVVTMPGIGDCIYEVTGTSKYMTGFPENGCRAKVRAFKNVNGKRIYGDYSSTVSF